MIFTCLYSLIYIQCLGNMSHLIEDSSFYIFKSSQYHSIFLNHSSSSKYTLNQNSKNQLTQTFKKTISFPNICPVQSFNQSFIHKSQLLTLVVIKRPIDRKKYCFQGMVLQKFNKFSIKLKQKRILFGKEWMKQKKQSRVKLYLSFNTGQIRFIWPQLFYRNQQSILHQKITNKNLFYSLFKEFVGFFEDQFLPICDKVIFCSVSQKTRYGNRTQNKEVQKDMITTHKIQKMLKYLYTSTIIDTFQKDKESFKRTQDKDSKKKESIIRVQSNIDISFVNIGPELNLFAFNSIKKARQKLRVFGTLQLDQQMKFQTFFLDESSKSNIQNQYHYIFNMIGILKIENKKHFISSGGTCNVYRSKMIYQYIFSDDARFWIEENRNNPHNALEKCFAIKEAKKGFQDKIRHENQIVRQMKGGFSIYLPKYYRVQSPEKDTIRFKTDNLVIMDFLKGQPLDKFIYMNKETLSFWTKVFLVRNIVNGLRFISSYKIVHLDLKPNNILVINDLLTKIIDFSESYHSQVCNKDFFPGISLPYSCPDIFQSDRKSFNEKCDIFSLGVIMFELFIGAQMLQLSTSKDKMIKLYERWQYMKRMMISPQQIEDDNLNPIINIILILTMRCLDPRPENRPTLNWLTVILGQVLMYFKGQ